MRYFKFSSNLTLTFITVFVSSFSYGQESIKNFKEIHSLSLLRVKNSDYKTSDSTNQKNRLAQYLAKDYWDVEELTIADSLLKVNSRIESDVLKGTHLYIASQAHNDYDEILRDNYCREAYLIFKKVNDIEGVFFSLKSLLNTKMLSPGEAVVEQQNIENYYLELKNIADNSTYLPVKLIFEDLYLTKQNQSNNEVSDAKLNEIIALVNTYEEQYPLIVRDLVNGLSGAFGNKRNLQRTIEFRKKALKLATKNRKDYPSYFYNLGTTYFWAKQLDSAKVYLRKAYDAVPEKPKTPYGFKVKKMSAYNLSYVYRDIDQLEAALYFAQMGFYYSGEANNFNQKTQNKYAEKKFEVQKAKLETAKRELQLIEEKQFNSLILVALFVSLVMILFLVFIYRKALRLKEEANTLKNKREQLLRIVSHDLGEPLQVFSYSSAIIPKLIAKEKFKELATVQHTLSDTIIALQTILKNLFYWNKQMNDQNDKQTTSVMVDNEIHRIIKVYKDVAEIKCLEIELAMAHNIESQTNSFYFGNLLRNIIYNAIKHSLAGHTIYINASKDLKQGLIFECKNTINPDYSESVVELIEHLQGKRKLDYSRTGLGIELIDEAIKNLKARVEAKLEGQLFSVKIILPEDF